MSKSRGASFPVLSGSLRGALSDLMPGSRHVSRRSGYSRTLAFESLEERTLMAGDLGEAMAGIDGLSNHGKVNLPDSSPSGRLQGSPLSDAPAREASRGDEVCDALECLDQVLASELIHDLLGPLGEPK